MVEASPVASAVRSLSLSMGKFPAFRALRKEKLLRKEAKTPVVPPFKSPVCRSIQRISVFTAFEAGSTFPRPRDAWGDGPVKQDYEGKARKTIDADPARGTNRRAFTAGGKQIMPALDETDHKGRLVHVGAGEYADWCTDLRPDISERGDRG